jgi:hypothetical protein
MLHIYPGDAQDNIKHLVWLITSLPRFLNGKRLHAVVIVVIYHMPVLIVVVEDLGIFEGSMYLLISVGVPSLFTVP